MYKQSENRKMQEKNYKGNSIYDNAPDNFHVLLQYVHCTSYCVCTYSCSFSIPFRLYVLEHDRVNVLVQCTCTKPRIKTKF